jgi:hypothetical protein
MNHAYLVEVLTDTRVEIRLSMPENPTKDGTTIKNYIAGNHAFRTQQDAILFKYVLDLLNVPNTYHGEQYSDKAVEKFVPKVNS